MSTPAQRVVLQGEARDVRTSKPKPGDVLGAKYRLEGLLGSGGMGAVYAARNLATGKRVALKWVLAERASDQELLSRFQREARAAGRIDHPNVVSVYDVGQHGPSTFLVMELLHGQPLSKVLTGGPLPQDVAIALLMPALRGIAAAHAQGVVHRDLKPDNLFLCTAPDGTPRETKVLDFGVSKMLDEVRVGLSVTKTGAVVGTPYYMSPEQVRGMRDIDHRIDVYAMGVILYEMLARRPPFVADSYTALVVEIATGSPPSLLDLRPDVDPGLVAVIQRAMARSRGDRYPDIESFARALEPFGDGTKFEPERPDWTARISTKSASVVPTAAAGDSQVDEALSGARNATLPAGSESDALEEAVTAAALPISIDEMPIEEAPASGDPVDVPATTMEPAAERGPRSSGARRRWIGGGVLAAVLLLAGLALLIGDDASEPPPAASEPTMISAGAEDEGAATSEESEAEAVEEPAPPAGRQELPAAPETAQAGDDQSGDEQAAEGEEARDDAPLAPSETSATTDSAAQAGGTSAAAAESAARARERRAAARRRARREARAAMIASPESPMRSGPRPRAGSLTLDDF